MKIYFFSILFSLLIPFYSIYAGLADSYGFSAVGIGRAGSFVADAYGWISAFYNMGGATFSNSSKVKDILIKNKQYKKEFLLEKNKNLNNFALQTSASDLYNQVSEIGLTYMYQITTGKINLNLLTIQGEKNRDQILKNITLAESDLNYGILQLGMSIDLAPIIVTPYNTPMKLVLALTVRDNGSLANINDIDPVAYNFLRYGKEAETITVITGLSFQLWKDRLSVGVGGNLGLRGNVAFNITNVNFKLEKFQLPGHEFRADIRPDFSAVLGFVYIQPILSSHEIRLGGSYKQETEVNLDPISGKAEVETLDFFIGLTFSLLDFYIPNIYTAGLSYHTNLEGYHLIFSYDQEYQEWSRSSSSSSKVLFFNNKGVNIPKLKDILISKGSIEYRPIYWPFELRGGYAYQPSFAPEQSGVTNFLDNSRHIMAFGFSLLFNKNFILKSSSKLNIGIQYQKSDTKTVTKENLLAIALNPNYTYSSDVLIVGADFVLIF